MSSSVSPLAPKTTPDIGKISGVKMATAAAGIKYQDRTDLLMMVFDRPAAVAGVFTQSLCPSAPVDFCRKNLPGGYARALVVNSGNANAFTGKKGVQATEQTAKAAASAIGCSTKDVFLASTGVIGEPMDASGFESILSNMAGELRSDGWQDAATTIMTTDTFPKLCKRTIELDDHEISIGSIAKGAGMIAPDMATMLSFIVTDLSIKPELLQSVLSDYVTTSFNAITVDSDTSTSDTVLLFATGASEDKGAKPIISPNDPRLSIFGAAISEVMQDLALQIVCDGEGATKLIEITVSGAESVIAAKNVAMTIGNSPLVKTAAAGEDANWGRVIMAVGKAGEKAERDLLQIWFGDIRVACDGERDPDYSEEEAAAVMKNQKIKLKVDLGVGNHSAKIWACDLTKEYVAINGDYRS